MIVKSQLIKRLAIKQHYLDNKQVEELVNLMLTAMKSHLAEQNRIEVRGFGSFSIKTLKPRLSRNPRTGEKLTAPERRAIHFKPGQNMKNRIDQSRDVITIQCYERNDKLTED